LAISSQIAGIDIANQNDDACIHDTWLSMHPSQLYTETNLESLYSGTGVVLWYRYGLNILFSALKSGYLTTVKDCDIFHIVPSN